MRLRATLAIDCRLQLRNGFYAATAFLVVSFGILLSQLPEFDWRPWLPPLILGNILMTTFFFVAGLVLLEKREGTLESLVVTPLRVREYLGSKIVTLTALSIAESTAVVLLCCGPRFAPLPLIAGIVLAAAVYTLAGVVAVARYDSINEFLFPSMAFVVLFALPYVDYFGLWQTSFMLLHPMQGPLLAMRSAFENVSAVHLTLGCLSTLAWCGVFWIAASGHFRRFVVRREVPAQ